MVQEKIICLYSVTFVGIRFELKPYLICIMNKQRLDKVFKSDVQSKIWVKVAQDSVFNFGCNRFSLSRLIL